ncbi:MAG: Maf family protein [Nitrospiraceae bacterium]|nr:Maf family protein [Nitrospiraceae bacterium]
MRENKTMKIVLASASERRKEIFGLTGLEFTVKESGAEEHMNAGVPPRRLARMLSRQKAAAVAAQEKNAIVIAADTFTIINGLYLGKARDQAEARAMLRKLNGKKHLVITGYTVTDSSTGRSISGFSETKVYFRRLGRQEIDSYIRTGEPIGKAGAYAIQGLGAVLVRKIEGDFFNVVGLPLSALMNTLKKFGIRAI